MDRVEDAGIGRQFRFELDPLAALILECAPQLGECFSFSIKPPGYKWYDGCFEWLYEDWEPDTDFSFGYEVYREMP